MIKRNNKSNTYDQIVELFIQEKISIGASKETLYNYRNSLRYFKEQTGINSIEELNKTMVQKWITSIKDKSTSTINHYIREIRVFTYWCIENNYVLPFKINTIRGQENKIKYYSEEALSKLIFKPSERDNFSEYRTYVMICFVLSTGCRASTIVNIKLDDIDFKSDEIFYSTLKNKKTKTVPLVPSLKKILLEYLQVWNLSESEYLFCNNDGKQLSVNAFQLAMERYCKRRGVECKGVHALRHSYARSYIIAGGNSFQLKEMLTHSDISTTQRYVRLFTDDLREDAIKYNPLDLLKTTKIRKNA